MRCQVGVGKREENEKKKVKNATRNRQVTDLEYKHHETFKLNQNSRNIQPFFFHLKLSNFLFLKKKNHQTLRPFNQ